MSFIVENKINLIKKPNRVLCKTTKSDKIVGLDPDGKVENIIKKINLDENTDDKFQVIPNVNTEREIIFVSGASGSGKSYFTKKYIEEYRKLFSKNKIYLISVLEENEFEKLGVKKLNVEKLSVADVNLKDIMKDLADSLIIFDDSDSFKEKNVKNFVWVLLDNVAQIGRHHNISMVVSSHVLSNYKQTKIILLESHRIVVFMNNYNEKMRTFLETYCNLDKTTILKLRKLKSRWVCINKFYPVSYISEKECQIINDSSEIEDAIAILEKKKSKNQEMKKPAKKNIIVNTA